MRNVIDYCLTTTIILLVVALLFCGTNMRSAYETIENLKRELEVTKIHLKHHEAWHIKLSERLKAAGLD